MAVAKWRHFRVLKVQGNCDRIIYRAITPRTFKSSHDVHRVRGP